MNTQAQSTTPVTVWIGIDVSKATLDVSLLMDGKHHPGQFSNDKEGHRKLLRWAQRLTGAAKRHFCMESTGTYSVACAVFLAEAQELVSVVNPYRARHAALAAGAISKTDPMDARDLAEFCRRYQPTPWRQSKPEIRTLVALVRHLDTLIQELAQVEVRLQDPRMLAAVRQSWEAMALTLKEQIDSIQKQIDQDIDQHPNLRKDRDLLLSIPGIGAKTAAQILAELPDVDDFEDTGQAASYAGLAPAEYRSGSSVRKSTRLSKKGNGRLRRALYWPAISAMRYNSPLKSFAERLLGNGKSKMAVIGAIMRKLLVMAVAILKSRKPFQSDYANGIIAA